MVVGACATTAPPPPPVLAYDAVKACTTGPDLALAEVFDPASKSGKRMMRSRTIDMMQSMTGAACMSLPDGRDVPYAIFRIPEGLTGRVLSAGSTIDSNSMFAADVSVLDLDGDEMRRFDLADYTRTGNRHAVQFSPRKGETFVLVRANPDLVGEGMDTSETGASDVYVSNGFGGGGMNTVGQTQAFSRSFSYDGMAGLRVTFPKQDRE